MKQANFEHHRRKAGSKDFVTETVCPVRVIGTIGITQIRKKLDAVINLHCCMRPSKETLQKTTQHLIDVDCDGSGRDRLSLRANVEEGAEVRPIAEVGCYAGANDVVPQRRGRRAAGDETLFGNFGPSFSVRYESVLDAKT